MSHKTHAKTLALTPIALCLSQALTFAAPSASAAMINVDAGVVAIDGSDNQCSLREAIINANDNADTHPNCEAGENGNDTLELTNSTYTLLDVYESNTGLPTIIDELTINGNGSTIERDQSSDPFRLLYAFESSTDNGLVPSLSLNDVTLSNGLLNQDSSGANRKGGAILIANDNNDVDVSLTLNSTTITGNQAVQGGAIALEPQDGQASAFMQGNNCTIINNEAEQKGGGIHTTGNNAANNSITLTDCTVSQNTAGTSGGAIFSDSDVTISGGQLSNNQALNGTGGAISVRQNDTGGGYSAGISITNATLTNNRAGTEENTGSGGAIHLTGTNYSRLTLELHDSTVGGNYANGAGGGINLDLSGLNFIDHFNTPNFSTLVISNSTISNNQATGNGGGLAMHPIDGATLSDCKIHDNDSGANGGGIHVAYINRAQIGPLSPSTINRCSIHHNTSAQSGGGAYWAGQNISFTGILNSSISHNSAGIDGGGIRGSALTLQHSTVVANEAGSHGGGLFRSFNFSRVPVVTAIGSSIISGNQALAGEGDEIYRNNGNDANDLASGVINSSLSRAADPIRILASNSVLGQSGSDQSQAFFGGFDPNNGTGNIVTSSDGDTPTALNDIVDTTLAANGGKTPTHALKAGSPALDAASASDCADVGMIDQRGVARGFDAIGGNDAPQADDCDIGAYEFTNLATVRVSKISDSVNTDSVDPFEFQFNPGSASNTLDGYFELDIGQSGEFMVVIDEGGTEYSLQETLPDGWQTEVNCTLNTIAVSVINPVDLRLNSADVLDCEFDNQELQRLRVTKISDVNANGQDDDESSLSGWDISLWESNSDTQVGTTQVTDGNGQVSFSGLELDTPYRLCETEQADWINTNAVTTTAPQSGLACISVTTSDQEGATTTATLLNTNSVDLSISKDDGITQAIAGADTVEYTITVQNSGPADSSGVSVLDTFDSRTHCSWTSAVSGGASGNSNSSGVSLNDTLSMPANSQVDYTVNCDIDPSARGTLSNTASVSPAQGVADLDGGNNSASDDDTVLSAEYNLSIDKSLDNSGNVGVEDIISYTLTVGNAGPSYAFDAHVQDIFSAPLGSTSWQCSADAQSSCDQSSGTGDIDTTVDIAPGEQVIFNIDVSGQAAGSLLNEATVTASSTDGSDPVPNNNSSAVNVDVIPTLSHWATAALALLMAAVGWRRARK